MERRVSAVSIAAGGIIWSIQEATKGLLELWQLRLLPPGPLEVCAIHRPDWRLWRLCWSPAAHEREGIDISQLGEKREAQESHGLLKGPIEHSLVPPMSHKQIDYNHSST